MYSVKVFQYRTGGRHGQLNNEKHVFVIIEKSNYAHLGGGVLSPRSKLNPGWGDLPQILEQA